MKMTTRISISAAVFVMSLFFIAAGSKTKPFEGTWKSGLDYNNAKYELFLSIGTIEDGKLGGDLRVHEGGYEVESLSLKSVVSGGDSLVIQTSSIDGRGANFQLKNVEGKLVGKMAETYSGKPQGSPWEMVFEKVKE